MTIKSKYVNDISQRQACVPRLNSGINPSTSFQELTKVIIKNGGQVVELDDPKLTHVILDKRDDSRRVELLKRTKL